MSTTAERVIDKLEELGLEPKQQKDNKNHKEVYRCISPFREDADGTTNFELRIDDDEHGGFSDYADPDKRSGSLYELAHFIGVETRTTKRSYKDANDYAESHGITLANLLADGWHETTKDNRPALAATLDDGSIKYRFLDGEEPRYKNTSGSKAQWYKLDRAVRFAQTNNVPLIICNGEISVTSAQYQGLPATSTTAGENTLPSDALLTELKEKYTGEIWIARDNDTPGKAAAIKLKNLLIDAGYSVRALDLGGWEGYDLADFVKMYQGKTLHEIKALPDLEEEITSDYFLTIDDILGMSKPEWLIENYLLEKRNTIIWGDSETFKTLYLLNRAFHLAEKEIVIWIAGEDIAQFEPYIQALIAHYQKKPRYLFIRDSSVNLLDTVDIDNFITKTKTEMRKTNKQVALIVFDTLRVCLVDGDENSSGDIAKGLQSVNKIRKSLDTTTATIHHATKNGNSYRGSAAIRNNTDAMIQHERDGDTVNITFDKLRGAKPKIQQIRMLPVDESVIVAPVSELTDQVLTQLNQADSVTTKHRTILTALAQNKGFGSKGLQRESITDATKIPVGSINRYLRELVADELIVKDNYFYRITEKGIAYIQ